MRVQHETKALLILDVPEVVRRRYHEGLAAAFPDLHIDCVGLVQDADPFLAEAEIIVTHGPYLRDRAAHVFTEARRLQWVQGIGVGVDGIADHPALRPGVVVTNMQGVHGPQMSETALLAMLALSRQLPRTVRNQDQEKWERWPARLITGKTVGILGVGSIAEALAPRCQAMGMRVVGISNGRAEVPGFDAIHPRARMLEAVATLDYFVVLVPYAPETHHVVDAAVFAAMKPGSYFINIARGGVVDEDALLATLREGRIAGAALDVFAVEPLPKGHPFWGFPNVIITCHQGSMHEGSAGQNLPVIIENVRRFLAGEGGRLINVVR